MHEPAESQKWKRKKLLNVHVWAACILAILVGLAACVMLPISSDYARCVNPDNWTKTQAKILKITTQREESDGARNILVLKMKVNSNRYVEDKYGPIKSSLVMARKAELEKQGTVTIYQNHFENSEYVLSPIRTAQERFTPKMLLSILFSTVIIGGFIAGWVYVAKQIESAAGMIHRTQFVAERSKRI